MGFDKAKSQSINKGNHSNSVKFDGLSRFDPESYLQKFGWAKGRGLGMNQHGTTSFIQVKQKLDNRGIGNNVDTKVEFMNKSFENIFNQAIGKCDIICYSSSDDEVDEHERQTKTEERIKKNKEIQLIKEKENVQEHLNTIKQRSKLNLRYSGKIVEFVKSSIGQLADEAKLFENRNFDIIKVDNEVKSIQKRDIMNVNEISGVTHSELLEFDSDRMHLNHSRVAFKLKRLELHDQMSTHQVSPYSPQAQNTIEINPTCDSTECKSNSNINSRNRELKKRKKSGNSDKSEKKRKKDRSGKSKKSKLSPETEQNMSNEIDNDDAKQSKFEKNRSETSSKTNSKNHSEKPLKESLKKLSKKLSKSNNKPHKT